MLCNHTFGHHYKRLKSYKFYRCFKPKGHRGLCSWQGLGKAFPVTDSGYLHEMRTWLARTAIERAIREATGEVLAPPIYMRGPGPLKEHDGNATH